MKSLFSQLTSLALRFRTVTLALVVLVTITGIIAITQLKQELIPSIEFPQTIILSEVAGMSSEQVLDVLTKRLESALGSVPEIVNMESTTTGSFGAIITARNDFGVNQERLRGKIQDALDQVWLPVRMIAPPDGENPQAFAERLLGDMTPDVLIYLAQNDSNFLFQLAPEVWQALPDDTVKALLTYLAGQTQESAGQESVSFAVWSSRKSCPRWRASRKSPTSRSAVGRRSPVTAMPSPHLRLPPPTRPA
ncbi:MAG: efflux RND transporter permease subunit [Anaerolineae bacterium]